ncbi:MAG: rhodanese-like domain-containing protein, partial [Planctomycetota bacterium]
TVREFEDGHPAGAINVPIMVPGLRGLEPYPDFLDVVAAVVPKDVAVIATCRTGQRSMLAAQLMAHEGWTKLANLRAGFAGHVNGYGQLVEAGWEGLALPVETGSPSDGRSLDDLRRKAGLED